MVSSQSSFRRSLLLFKMSPSIFFKSGSPGQIAECRDMCRQPFPVAAGHQSMVARNRTSSNQLRVASKYPPAEPELPLKLEKSCSRGKLKFCPEWPRPAKVGLE